MSLYGIAMAMYTSTIRDAVPQHSIPYLQVLHVVLKYRDLNVVLYLSWSPHHDKHHSQVMMNKSPHPSWLVTIDKVCQLAVGCSIPLLEMSRLLFRVVS